MKGCDIYSLVRFARGLLSDKELVKILEHLEECPDCRESLRNIARLHANREAIGRHFRKVS